MLCLIFKDKMNKVDKVFGAAICTLIWAIYLLKATFYIEYPNVINWTRFYIGIIFVALTMIYMIYCIQDKIRYHA